MKHLALIAKLLKFSSLYARCAVPYGEILFYINQRASFFYKAFRVLFHPYKYYYLQSSTAAF